MNQRLEAVEAAAIAPTIVSTTPSFSLSLPLPLPPSHTTPPSLPPSLTHSPLRDSHKAAHSRDRSVSPAPPTSSSSSQQQQQQQQQQQTQSKPPQQTKASFKSSTTNPTKRQHITKSPSPSSAKKSKTVSKHRRGLDAAAGAGGKNLTVPPRGGAPGGIKADKGRPKLTKAGSLPVRSGSSRMGGVDIGGHQQQDLYSTHEISPLRSGNPTPEPGVPPPKTITTRYSSSSSSSSSGSSSSDSMGEELEAGLGGSHAHHVTSVQRVSIPQARSIAAGHSDIQKGGAMGEYTSYSQSAKSSQYQQASASQSTLYPTTQRGDKGNSARSLSRSSSAGRPNPSAPPPSRPPMSQFMDKASLQLLNRSSSAHEIETPSYPQQQQPLPPPPVQHSQQSSSGGLPGLGPGMGIGSSSSSSDSDSSSGSSSSNSSSDSDEENDREVVS